MNQFSHTHIYIISDTPIFSGGLAALLTELGMQYITHIVPLHQLKHNYRFHLEDIVVFYLTTNAFEKNIAPLIAIKKYTNCKILAIGRDLDTDTIKALYSMGVNGYISKADTLSTVLTAIEQLKSGNHFFPMSVAKTDTSTSNPAPSLPQRELEVLVGISKGQSSQQIADSLFISLHTVQTYRKRLFKRLGVNTAAALIKMATSNGLI